MKTRIKQTIALLFVIGNLSAGFCQENPQAYTIFNGQGKQVSFKQMIAAISQKQVVFFGEMHNCPISHWLEFKTAKALYDTHHTGLIMGAEMFEADNQLILDEFLQNKIPEKSFESEMRLWDNYPTDYVKLIDFAKEKKIPFVATNIPRRYARIVSDKGLKVLNHLSTQAQAYIAPLPIPYKADSAKIAMFGQMSALMGHTTQDRTFVAQAQAIKDATMAWHIAQSLRTGIKSFLHFNGSFHSDGNDGIIPFLCEYKKGVSTATVSCCRQEELSQLEEVNIGRADFIICIPESMVNSY